MSGETTLKVIKRVEETDDAVSLYFKKSFFTRVKYKSGQFLTLVFTINGEEYKRAYSLNSAPGIDSDLSVTVKKVLGGVVSNHVFNNVKEGDSIKVIKPKGSFYLIPKTVAQRHVILFGGGSGITPLISIAKSVLHKEPKSYVSLIYCNMNEHSIIFKEALKGLEEEFQDRFRVIHFLEAPLNGWVGNTGRLTPERVGEALNRVTKLSKMKQEFYMCGPGGMMESVEKGLEMAGIAKEQIFKESFTADPSAKAAQTQNLNFEAQTLKLKLRKEEVGLHVPANTSVLDAALANKIKIPFSCCSGSCGTCMCKVENGEVEMVGNDHCLSEKDIKKGYVLACMSYPKTPEVVLKVV